MTLIGCSVLIVEPDTKIGLTLASAVCVAGGSVAKLVDSAANALALVEGQIANVAILSGALPDNDALRLVHALRKFRIPFVVRKDSVSVLVDAMSNADVAVIDDTASVIDLLSNIRRRTLPTRPRIGKLALVIENDKITAEILDACLRHIGYDEVEHVACELGALAAVRVQRPDLVVADIRLGSDNGLAAAAVIRIAYNVPRIIVTAYPRAALGVEPEAVVAKPFTVADLKRAIEHALACR